jgi:hypothetical protein
MASSSSASTPPPALPAAAPLPVLEASLMERLNACADILAEERATRDSPAWRLDKTIAPGLDAFSRAVPGTALRKCRAMGDVAAPPSAVARLLWEAPRRLGWDASYAGDVEVVPRYDVGGVGGRPGDHVALHHLMLKPVLVVSARDFCNLQLLRADEAAAPLGGERALFSVSFTIDHPGCPEQAGYVRGAILPGSAWHLTPIPAPDGSGGVHTRLEYYILTDVKGWVPQFAVNAAVADTLRAYFTGVRDAVARGLAG